jgi:hypothetical protein
MKTLKVERYEEHTLILEQGVDYEKKELMPDRFSGGKLFHLSADRLTEIAKDKGFDKWTFSGLEEAQRENEFKTGIIVRFAKFI